MEDNFIVESVFNLGGYARYTIKDLGIIAREWESLTENKNSMNGRWVLRDECGCLLDYDQYINDLAERNCIRLY